MTLSISANDNIDKTLYIVNIQSVGQKIIVQIFDLLP